MKKIIIILLVSIVNSTTSYSEDKNILDEKNIIKMLSEQMPIKQAIGQLFIVQPSCNYFSCYENSNFLKLIETYKIGNFQLKNKNYESVNNIKELKYDKLDRAKGFHQFLRRKLRSDKNYPPILFIDFEKTGINSISNLNIIDPLESLTLSASYDKELIYQYGTYIANKLKSVQVDAIFGPVLDIDGTEQGTIDYKISNRVFGDRDKIVIGAASHYIKGLEDKNILTIIKHFPGFGHVKGRAHFRCEDIQDRNCDVGISDLSAFKGNNNNFSVNIAPFSQLIKLSSGMMTSHFYIKNYQYNILTTFMGQPFNDLIRTDNTVNIKYIGDVNGINNNDKITITDDLSEMAIVNKYINQNKISYSDAVIKAINSGHDMLLFGEVFENDSKEKSRFTINDLSEIIKNLYEQAKINKSFEIKIRKSVYRILTVKQKLIKSWSSDNTLNKWDLPLEVNSWMIENNKQNDVNEGNSLMCKILNKSFLNVNRIDDKKIDSNDNILFIYSNNDTNCKIFFKAYNNITLIQKKYNTLKNDDYYDEIVKFAKNDNAKLFFQYDNPEIDNKILQIIDNKFNEYDLNKNKVFIIIHTSPKSLKDDIISSFNVVGNFSMHKLSYESDNNFAVGQLDPGDSNKLPVSLGISNSINISDNFLEPATKIENSSENSLDNNKEYIKNASSDNSKISSDINYGNIVVLLWKLIGFSSIMIGIGCFSKVYRHEKRMYCIHTWGGYDGCDKNISKNNKNINSIFIILLNMAVNSFSIKNSNNSLLMLIFTFCSFLFIYTFFGVVPEVFLNKLASLLLSLRS